MLIVPDENLIPTSSGATIYVPTDYPTIQDGINAANDGDTVFVYSGIYHEMVVIKKTINLTGENRETTIIVGGFGEIIRIEANWVNISGFTTNYGNIGIYLNHSLNCNISDCTISDVNPMEDTGAIHLYFSDYNTITNCTLLNNGVHGIYIDLSSNHNIITNCNVSGSDHTGIYVWRSNNITIAHCNTLSNGYIGIRLSGSPDCRIIDTNASSNNFFGIGLDGGSIRNIITHCKFYYNGVNGLEISGDDFNLIEHCDISYNDFGIQAYFASDNIIENCNILSNEYGVGSYSYSNNKFINSTILHSTYQDFYLDKVSHVTTLNTTFNKTKVFYNDPSSNLTVKWFMHVKVIDFSGNPIRDAEVNVKNVIGHEIALRRTDMDGWTRWIVCTEYVGVDLNDDGDDSDLGERVYNTPHNVTATKNGTTGYASPEPYMNKSKTVTIILYNGTSMDLEPGWNLVSLPRIQSDTNLPTVLQSIKGQYDAVQWYNVTDSNDPWKHNHILKPSNLNDLSKINHTIGLWVHITDPGGTTFVVFGDILTSDMHIPLYPGWNLVGFPSRTNKTRDIALGTLNFGSDVDSIWTFNSTSQKWVELDDSMDYFEVGKGYWIHSKVTKTWIVPH